MTAHNTRLSSSVTVEQYLQIEADDDRAAAGRFIKERFDERYLSPLLDVDWKQRHGFSMMAVACLAIEALQAFRLGLKSTKDKSADMFAGFFKQPPPSQTSPGTVGSTTTSGVACCTMPRLGAAGAS